MTSKTKVCDHCGGRGWFIDSSMGVFASIGRLALNDRLPMKNCGTCGGTGKISKQEKTMTSKMFYKNHALWLNLLDDDGCIIPVADFAPNSRIGMCATPRADTIGPKLAELWNQQFQNEDGKDK